MGPDFRILVTDDDPESLLLMTSVLQRAGYGRVQTGISLLKIVYPANLVSPYRSHYCSKKDDRPADESATK